MTQTSDIVRPPKELIEGLKEIGAATVAGTLGHMGFRNPHMVGPVVQNPGKSIVGPALTLQFLPQRPDLFSEGEYADPETQLHRHVLYHAQEGDVVVVDARADMSSGVFGDMMSTYFKGRGGAGIVIDGCMRDRPNVQQLDLPLWLRGWTPNYHVQTSIYPTAVNVPIACGGVTVIPGDIIVEIEGRPVRNAQELFTTLGRFNVGDKVTLSVVRLGEKIQIPIKLDGETPAPQ